MVLKKIEIIGTSPDAFYKAVENAVKEASGEAADRRGGAGRNRALQGDGRPLLQGLARRRDDGRHRAR